MFTAIMKRLTAAVLIVLGCVAIADAQVCTPVPVGLVSWYPADGNALDSRSRLNGGLAGNATFGAGQVGQAFNLDGNNDSVQIPHDASQNITGSFSAEAWIFPRTVPNAGPRIFDKDTAVGNSPRWLMSLGTANQLSATINGSSIDTPDNSISLNQWNHVAFTYDRGDGRVRLFVNGVLLVNINIGPQTAITTAPLFIGDDSGTGTREFDGLIDEPAIYNRALSDTEISAIHAAGTAGKCKPTATVAPSGLVGWWAGDGDARDSAGTNNGTLANGAGFVVGRVGQAFNFDGNNDHFRVTNAVPLNPLTNSFTVEAWIRTTQTTGDRYIVSSYGLAGNNNGLSLYTLLLSNGVLTASIRDSNGGGPDGQSHLIEGNGSLADGSFHHVLMVRNMAANTANLYVDGVLNASEPLNNGSNGSIDEFDDGEIDPFVIGGSTDTGVGVFCCFFSGVIDEVSLYNRALTQDEITSIFNAGIAGKLKQNATPVGSVPSAVAGGSSLRAEELYSPDTALTSEPTGKVQPPATAGGTDFAPEAVNTVVGDATITFPTVTTGGTTQQIPLLASVLPPLPMGNHTGLLYDIATSAVFTGSPTVCFNLPSFPTAGIFSNLRVMHLESGVWQNRTTTSNFATRTLCSDVTTLSPFAIALLAPTSANVSVSGRVVTAKGRGIAGARITLSDSNGIIRAAMSNTFGYYQFQELPAGRTYILTAGSKRFTFENPTQVVTPSDSISDLNFTASP